MLAESECGKSFLRCRSGNFGNLTFTVAVKGMTPVKRTESLQRDGSD